MNNDAGEYDIVCYGNIAYIKHKSLHILFINFSGLWDLELIAIVDLSLFWVQLGE